ncbi:MAG: VWA domain-containing protein [Acidobacteriota bacterium]|nr:VWA domain-containing protein [Blastocatellia bacterium]MDW8412430.1 VWA domain-containing protein [Acidobacteriota bacterium]
MRFEYPWVLLLLTLNFPLAFLLGSKARLRLPSTTAISRTVGKSLRLKLARYRPFLQLLVFSLIVIALARPQTLRQVEQVKAEVIDIIITLDISLSMGARDFGTETRLEVAKRLLDDFVARRKGDRLGLITFAAYSQLRCPLTLDHEVLRQVLSEVELVDREDLEANGTAIGLAISSGVDHLRHSATKSRILVLLTDGDNNISTVEPETAAEVARVMGVKVYAVGIGSQDFVEMPSTDPADPVGTYKLQRAGFNEELLKTIAAITSGKYFPAADSNSLEGVLAEIDNLERTKMELERYEHYGERYTVFVFLATGLLLLDLLLEHTYLRVLP